MQMTVTKWNLTTSEVRQLLDFIDRAPKHLTQLQVAMMTGQGIQDVLFTKVDGGFVITSPMNLIISIFPEDTVVNVSLPTKTEVEDSVDKLMFRKTGELPT